MGTGALYYGLPLARHRNKLFQSIDDAIHSQIVRIDEKTVAEKLKADSDLADDYHTLAMWWNELPASIREKSRNIIGSLFEGVSQLRTLPWYYRWFKKNGDKVTCLIVSVIVPLAGLWIVHLFPFVIERHMWFCELWLVSAQVWVIGHMIGGSWMVHISGKRINEKLSTVITKLKYPDQNIFSLMHSVFREPQDKE